MGYFNKKAQSIVKYISSARSLCLSYSIYSYIAAYTLEPKGLLGTPVQFLINAII